MMMRTLPCIFAIGLLLGGCASMSPEEKRVLEEKKSHVAIVSTMSASDAVLFQEVGPVKCDIYWHNLGQDCEESCRDTLKEQAAQMNAQLVVVESRQTKKCQYGLQDDTCVAMTGRAYIKRPPEKS